MVRGQNGEAVAPVFARERYKVCYNRRDDTGQSGCTFAQQEHEIRGALRGVAVRTWIDGHHQHVVGAKAYVDGGCASQAAQEEAGYAEQDDRHCDLRDDEEVTEGEAAPGASEGIFAFESVGEQRSSGCPCGCETKQKAADNTDCERVE